MSAIISRESVFFIECERSRTRQIVSKCFVRSINREFLYESHTFQIVIPTNIIKIRRFTVNNFAIESLKLHVASTKINTEMKMVSTFRFILLTRGTEVTKHETRLLFLWVAMVSHDEFFFSSASIIIPIVGPIFEGVVLAGVAITQLIRARRGRLHRRNRRS